MIENEKYTFKMILKECLRKFNLDEIINNEVILSYMTVMLIDENYNICDDMSYALSSCRNSNEEYDNCKSKCIDKLEKEINKHFKIYVTDKNISIEQNYIEYENYKKIYLDNDMPKTINKQILENVSLILGNQFNGYKESFYINTDKLIYDKKTFKTSYLQNKRTYDVSISFISHKPTLDLYNKAIFEEYDKQFKMISDKKYTCERGCIIENDNFINDIEYCDAYNNDEKQEFITAGDITQCNFKYRDNEYSFNLPTSRDAQIINYADGDSSFTNIENLEEHLEFIAMLQNLYDEKPVVGITYVYSEKFLETVRDIKQDYEDKINEKIGREGAEKNAKQMGLTLDEYLNRFRSY